MTIRAAVTVTLAMALVAASLPAVEEARIRHSDDRVAAEVDRLELAAAALAGDNEVVPTDPARSRLTLFLPRRSWGDSGLAHLSIPAETGGIDVNWSVQGGPIRTRQAAVDLVGAGDGLRIEAGGRQRLVLELRRRATERVVVVRRPSH